MGKNKTIELGSNHPFKEYLDNYEYFEDDKGFFYLKYKMHPITRGLLGTSGALFLIIRIFLIDNANDFIFVLAVLLFSFALYILSISIPCFLKKEYFLIVEENIIEYKKKKYLIIDIKDIIIRKTNLNLIFTPTQKIEIPYRTMNFKDMKLFLATIVKTNPDLKQFFDFEKTI